MIDVVAIELPAPLISSSGAEHEMCSEGSLSDTSKLVEDGHRRVGALD
ncbi:MAG: hypothetical protein ACTHQQ_15020 [Solirubrobacteraceae bacterium]